MIWKRVPSGYELHVPALDDAIYTVTRRAKLTHEQKWALDRRLGLKPRDGKRRETWVILRNDEPYDHSYSKDEAVTTVNAEVARRIDQQKQERPRQGPRIGLSLSQSQDPLYPPDESVVSRREDLRAMSEHLPVRSTRFGSRRRYSRFTRRSP